MASRYEEWYAGAGRRADALEKRLLRDMLSDFVGVSTVLEVGCGTGHFSRWLAEQDMRVFGLDLSWPMLAEAQRSDGLLYARGNALRLPFRERSFDLVVLITTLEFLDDPRRALAEAARAASRGLLLGVLNRHSLLAVRRRASAQPPWDTAQFFSPWQLAHLVREATGQRLRSLRWRTTLWPVPFLANVRLPWGGFIGMSVRIGRS